jgi:hypothetical protein
VTQEYTGRSPYFADLDEDSSLLLVAVACFVEDLPQRAYALLDTASPWCILPPSVAARLGLDPASGEETTSLSTRFGTLVGRLERVSLTFDASEGQPLTIQATCFVSADWPGPMVIGWKGCLERIHFGFDTTLELFYFAAGS